MISKFLCLPLKCLFTKEIAFGQHTYKSFLEGILRANGDLNLALRNDEERVTSRALTNDVVALTVVALFQDIRDFNKCIFRQVFEYWNTAKWEEKNT